ncbi:MAG: hypothetical protein ACOC0X_05755 [Halobacteriota archaeon]
MAKAAVVLLADTDGHENLGRAVNALETAREFAQTDGDTVEFILDGGGTEWLPELEDETGDLHDLYRSVRGATAVCSYCSRAFDVEDAVEESGVRTLDEHDGHPSIRSLVAEGYEVITF